MATHKTFDVVATVGEYPDPDNPGETKKRYKNCGAVFVRDDGSQFMKLDTVPVGEWSGWFQFYPPKNRQQQTSRPATGHASNEREQQQQQQQQQQTGAQHADGSPSDDDFDDDIPF